MTRGNTLRKHISALMIMALALGVAADETNLGPVTSLKVDLAGADDESALALGREGGLTRLEPIVRERLAEDDK